MDFYIDIGVAAILRLLKDRRAASKYHAALAKVFVALLNYAKADPAFARAIKDKGGEV